MFKLNKLTAHPYSAAMMQVCPVSYTHLDVYKRQIFMGVGAMTDFGPLLANPVSLLLGAAAQLGIYVAFIFANAITVGLSLIHI